MNQIKMKNITSKFRIFVSAVLRALINNPGIRNNPKRKINDLNKE